MSASASSSDGEGEAQLLRDCRLDQLRAAVLGVLAEEPRATSTSQRASALGGEDTLDIIPGDLPDLRLDEMRREAFQNLHDDGDDSPAHAAQDDDLHSSARSAPPQNRDFYKFRLLRILD